MMREPTRSPSPAPHEKVMVALSFDIEDWNQIMGARIGYVDGHERGRAFERQMRAIFELLDTTAWKATFFLLGTTVERHPDVVQEIASRGHEIASHGYRHEPVYRMTPEAFHRDVATSIEIIEKLSGKRPRGYRAPYFSINRDCSWAFEIIANHGFSYDSTQYDSPWVTRRIQGIPRRPYTMTLPSGQDLLEMPIAVWKLGHLTIPIGGGSYWRVLPTRWLHAGLHESSQSNACSAIYFHPYEYDPEALRIEPSGSSTRLQRVAAAYLNLRFNTCRKWIRPRLQTVVRPFEVTTYECVGERLRHLGGLVRRSLSHDGCVV